MADDIKQRVVFEYTGEAAYRSFVEDIQAASDAASAGITGLDSLADSITSVSDATGEVDAAPLTDLADSLTGVAEASDSIDPDGISKAASATGELTTEAAKAAVKQEQMARAAAEVEASQRKLVAAVNEFGAASREASQASDDLVAAEKQLAQAGKAGAEAQQSLSGAQKAAIGLGVGLAGVGQAARGIEAIQGAIAGVTQTLGDAANRASEYDQAVTFISTLSGEAAAKQDEFHAGILKVSQALGQDAVAGARAAYDAISSGVSADDALSFLETSSKAATAGLSSVDTAGKALTVTLNSFNLKADETTAVSDALFAAANVGVTTFDELASSFGGTASLAAASGASYKETLAALAQITTKGASTSEAVTQLKATFTALSKPSEEVSAALEKQGFTSTKAAIEAKGLQFVLELVRETSEKTGTPLIELVGSTEAVGAVLANTGVNAEGAREKIDALANSAGATEAAFEILSDTPAQQMAVFTSSVDAARIALGDALLPIIGSVLDALSPLVQGFASFATNVLAPLGQAFADLPQPITAVISIIGGLVAAGATLVLGLAGIAGLIAPLIGLFTGGGAAAGVLGGAMGLLGTSAAGAGTAMLGALGPIGLVVGILGTLYAAVGQANSALDEQLGVLDTSTAGFGDYAQAVATAREQSGLLGKIGFEVKDATAALSDEVTEASAGYRLAGQLIGDLWSAVSGGDEATDAAAEGLDKTGKAAKATADDLILASQAWLEQGTNIDPAVLASEKFTLSQARLNASLREGKIDQDAYQAGLLEAANAASQAAGAGAVLTAQQQQVEASFTGTLQTLAESSGTLSAASLASEEYAAKQAELAQAVATGAMSASQAEAAWTTYTASLAANDTTTQAALSANQQLVSGFADLQDQLNNGSISFSTALANLQALGEQAGATGEQMGTMTAALQEAALSPELQSFGVSLDFGTIIDPEKLTKALDETRATANEGIYQIFSEQLQAREEFASAEQAIIAERGPALAKAEADAAAAIQAAREAGGDNVEQKVADLQAGLAKEVEAINTGNAEKLTTLQAGFEQERQARLTALAQTALDQVNSLLSLGQISEQQAQIIFGSLKDAAPDSALFDPAAEAAMKFSAVLGQATAGNVEAAVGLGDALRGVDAAIDESVAHSETYATESIAAYESARVAVEGSAQGAVVAADIESEAVQRRIDRAMELDAVMAESVDTHVAARDLDAQSSSATADVVTTDDQRRIDSLDAATGATTSGYDAQSSARESAAGVSKATTDEMVSDTARLASETQGTAGAVDQSVRAIGGAYQGAGAGVKSGTDAIVTNVATANRSLSNLGTGVPGALAPATESVSQLRGGVQLLADDVDEASRVQISAQDDAASAATDASDDTVEGFQGIQKQGVETREEIVALKEAMEQLPVRIDIPLVLTGADAASKIIADVLADLDTLKEGVSFRIEGSYTGTGGAEKQSPMAVLSDVRDLYDTTANPFQIEGTYDGSGPMAWDAGTLAIASAVDGLLEVTRDPISLSMQLEIPPEFAALLFGPGASGAERIRQLAAAVVETTTAAQAFDKARLDQAISRVTVALDAWFTASQYTEGSLQSIIMLMGEAGQQFDAMGRLIASPGFNPDQGSLLNSLGIDASTFAEVQAQIAALAGEPERQHELWKTVVDGITAEWKRFYESQRANLEAQKQKLEDQIKLLKEQEGTDNDVERAEAEIETIERVLDAYARRNEQITDGLSLQGDGLDRMLDAYSRIADEQERLQRAQEAAVKALQDDIKARQKSAEDTEKDAHDQAMDLLADEMKQRERAYKERMAFLDSQRRAEEDAIKARAEEEERLHKQNLANITAQVDAADALNKSRRDEIAKAKELIDLVENGIALNADQIAFLRGLGIDPDKLVATNAGLAQANTEIERLTKRLDVLKGLFDKLPTELGRVQIAGSNIVTEAGKQIGEMGATFGQAERDRLQEMLASGGLSKSDERIIRVFLAGGRVQSQRLREILGPAITADETALKAAQDQVELAKEQVDEAGKLLAAKEAQLKVDERLASEAREALQAQIDAENRRHEDVKAHAQDRLNQINQQREAEQEAFDQLKQAISDAKELEADRHTARMRAINEEYALELLRAGKTEAEVQRILADQQARAAAIALEAERRFKELLAAAEAAAAPVVGVVVGAPGGRQAKPTPPPPPAPPIPSPTPPGTRPLPFFASGGQPIALDEMFDGIGPALGQLDQMRTRAVDIAGLFASMPALGEAFATRDMSIDRRIIFNGPVTIDRDVAEEMGLVDSARVSTP